MLPALSVIASSSGIGEFPLPVSLQHRWNRNLTGRSIHKYRERGMMREPIFAGRIREGYRPRIAGGTDFGSEFCRNRSAGWLEQYSDVGILSGEIKSDFLCGEFGHVAAFGLYRLWKILIAWV